MSWAAARAFPWVQRHRYLACRAPRKRRATAERAPDRRNEVLERARPVGCLAGTLPHTGPGPGGVVPEAGNQMDVQLRHHIAERRDIELVTGGHRLAAPRSRA